MQPEPRPAGVARLALSLAALWVLAGAVAKLFWATPKDLPATVVDLSPLPIGTTYVAVIGAELALVALAFLRPRIAWLPVVALYLVFEVILAGQLSRGAESCGCFGATIAVDPWLMVAVDGALLTFVLATRPWRNLREGGASLFVLASAVALAFVVPWVVLERRQQVAAPVQGSDGAVAAVAVAGKFVVLEPAQWVGREVGSIEELTRWVPAEALPLFGKILLWRASCDHCKTHLADVARADDGSQQILLLQVRADLASTPVVDVLPSGPHVATAAFPENLQVYLETPWEVRVDGGVVREALDREATDALHPR
jgi:hypothetical protein